MSVKASIKIWEKELVFITLDMDIHEFQYILDHLEDSLVEEYCINDDNFNIDESEQKITISFENYETMKELITDLIIECELSIEWSDEKC